MFLDDTAQCKVKSVLVGSCMSTTEFFCTSIVPSIEFPVKKILPIVETTSFCVNMIGSTT